MASTTLIDFCEGQFMTKNRVNLRRKGHSAHFLATLLCLIALLLPPSSPAFAQTTATNDEDALCG